MRVLVSPHAKRRYRKLIKKDRSIRRELDRTISDFIKNPKKKSLRLHKLSGKKLELWSLTVTRDLRIIFRYVRNGIVITNIGSHKEVY